MKYIPLEISDVVLIEPQIFGDHRGFFLETFREDEFNNNITKAHFVQDNHSKSTQGILRGLHYQIERSQGKLVRVIAGEVFDVAVDIRKNSKYFGKWVGTILSSQNNHMLWVPPGFAHGFYVISPEAEFVYKCTDYYAPEHERSILWNDSSIDIDWPLIQGSSPILSEKDENAPNLEDAEVY